MRSAERFLINDKMLRVVHTDFNQVLQFSIDDFSHFRDTKHNDHEYNGIFFTVERKYFSRISNRLNFNSILKRA